MTLRTALLPMVAAAALAAGVAGCGGSDDSGSAASADRGGGYGPPPAPAEQDTGSGGQGQSAATGTRVPIKDFAFSPATLEVRTGQKVTWRNEDSATHNVTADGGEFRSGSLDQGATFSYTPAKAGTIRYECTLHPGMTGELVVR